MWASRRVILGVLAVGCGVAALASPSGAAVDSSSSVPPAGAAGCGGVQRFAPGRRITRGRAPLAIGDSVLLGAAPAVAARGYEVDVRGCRQMSEGLGLLRARARAGTLPGLVVIVLGTNGPITRADLSTALRIVGPRRTLGLVTPRELGGGSGSDAATLRAVARDRPKRTLLLDWVAFAGGRGGLTYSDGIHLTAAGYDAMADLLARGLARAYPPVDRWRQLGVRP
jgi:lysophospholipase L1-like esterase